MATIEVSVTADADDGSEYSSTLDISFMAAGFVDPDAYTAFARFQGVNVPQGATINSATLTIPIETADGTPDTTFYGVDVDDAPAFASPGNMPTAAARTTASTTGFTATGTQAIDVAAIVQEIVNRGGWVSGNAMAFVCIDNAGSGTRYWDADYEAGAAQPKLNINYTAAGGAAGPLVAGKLVGRGILGGRLIA